MITHQILMNEGVSVVKCEERNDWSYKTCIAKNVKGDEHFPTDLIN